MSAGIPLLIILSLVAVCLVVKLLTYREARDWFEDYNNKKKFLKHFHGEAVYTYVYTATDEVRFHFSHKRVDYDIVVNLRKAKELYDITQGGGIRRTLKKVK